MSLFPKHLPGSVRDVLVQSIRRSPAGYPNAHGGDSLRRFVLKRNAFVGAVDAQDMALKPSTSLRRITGDFTTNGPQEESSKGRMERTAPIRRSRSVQHLSSSPQPLAEETSEEHLEDVWFDQIFDSLSLEESLPETIVDGDKNRRAANPIHIPPPSGTGLQLVVASS